MESGLDLENCVDILSLADTFSLQKLRPQVSFKGKKTFRNLKITPQVLRYMSENLSQLTGIVKKINTDLWDSYFKFSGTSEFLRLDSGQLISLLNSNFPINMSESEVRLVPGVHIFQVQSIFSRC